MSLFARIADGHVAEPPINLPDGVTPQEAFAPALASTFVSCGSNVQEGWTYDGTNFAAPVVPTPAPPPPQTIFAPRDFVNLFTAAERTALFTARRTNDQVDQFITLAGMGPVDLTNAEVIADVNAVATAGIITSDRAAQILAGTPAPTV